jgi:hypothetical protein
MKIFLCFFKRRTMFLFDAILYVVKIFFKLLNQFQINFKTICLKIHSIQTKHNKLELFPQLGTELGVCVRVVTSQFFHIYSSK